MGENATGMLWVGSRDAQPLPSQDTTTERLIQLQIATASRVGKTLPQRHLFCLGVGRTIENEKKA